MILRDKVTVAAEQYPAAVQPINSDQNMAAQNQVITRFRMFLARSAPEVDNSTPVTWRGKDYMVVGAAEPHTINGRLSHYEYVMERVTG